MDLHLVLRLVKDAGGGAEDTQHILSARREVDNTLPLGEIEAFGDGCFHRLKVEAYPFEREETVNTCWEESRERGDD